MATGLLSQILGGALVGGVVTMGLHHALAGKRGALEALEAGNRALEIRVDNGRRVKARCEGLQDHVARLDRRLGALTQSLASEGDSGDLPRRIKKLADAAGVDQLAFARRPERQAGPWMEKPVEVEFRAGFQAFGRFAALLSGQDRILTLSNLEMGRRGDPRTLYSTTVKCTISAYGQHPDPRASEAVQEPRRSAPQAAAPGFETNPAPARPYNPVPSRDPFVVPQFEPGTRRQDLMDDASFKGWVRMGGSLFVVVADRGGRVRWLTVGHRFTDAEIVAISEEAVTARQWDPRQAPGGASRIVIRTFKREEERP